MNLCLGCVSSDAPLLSHDSPLHLLWFYFMAFILVSLICDVWLTVDAK